MRNKATAKADRKRSAAKDLSQDGRHAPKAHSCAILARGHKVRELEGRNAMARNAHPKRAKRRVKAQDLPPSGERTTAKKMSAVKGGGFNPKEISIDNKVR
jgi:hypothetical protein